MEESKFTDNALEFTSECENILQHVSWCFSVVFTDDFGWKLAVTNRTPSARGRLTLCWDRKLRFTLDQPNNTGRGGVKFDDPKCMKNGFYLLFLLNLFINKASKIEICRLKRSQNIIRISNICSSFETLSILVNKFTNILYFLKGALFQKRRITH